VPRRPLLVLLLALPLAAGPARADNGPQQASVDSRIEKLNRQIAKAHVDEGILTSQIGRLTKRIRSLRGSVASADARLGVLEGDLTLHQSKLEKLTRLFELETQRLIFLRKELTVAQVRLDRRVIQAYEAQQPDPIGTIFGVTSFSDFLDSLDYLNQIAAQDSTISGQIRSGKKEMARLRKATEREHDRVAQETHTILVKTEEQRAVRARLTADRASLTAAVADEHRRLASTQESKAEYLREVEGLQAVSEQLGAQIRAAQAAAAPTLASAAHVSSSGFIWPVQGPVVSGFGMRWGRMHEGIDIAVAYGTPIHAAAAGTVIYCGWESGYGNFVVIDHHNSLATAYAHQSRIGVACGQSVAQGDVIGYVGCTGHCFGPHLHFEVRVNGTPVDPLRYL
jgi:murein DD-endopeptidase MepM/ murein hydrolase activator NlpD